MFDVPSEVQRSFSTRPDSNLKLLKGRDRRGAPRYTVAEHVAWVGWWDGPKYRTVPAKIEDICQTGALILVAELPPEGHPVWVRIESPMTIDWSELVVVGMLSPWNGVKALRVAFATNCPYDMFKMALSIAM